MIQRFLDALASVVQHACQAERHEVSLFLLGDESDQPTADVLSPTQMRTTLAGSSVETKCREVAISLQ